MNSMKKTFLPLTAALALASLTLTACGGTDAAAQAGQDSNEVVQLAGQEGELVVYSAASDDVNAALIKAFNAEHPDIKVTMSRFATGDLRSRFASETTSGAKSADAVIVTDPLLFNEDPDWFAKITADAVPNIANVKTGYAHDAYTAVVTSPWVATYNTQKISTGPITWEDLAKPEYAQDTTLSNPQTSSDSVLSFYQILMDEYGSGYLKTLAEQNKDWFDSSVPAVQKVAAGQVALAAPGAKSHSSALVKAGAPLKVVVPTPVIAFSNLVGVASNASHPNAAMLFTNFLLSTEGQAAYCGDNLYLSIIKGEVPGCSPTPEDARIADPVRAQKEHDAIISAFKLN